MVCAVTGLVDFRVTSEERRAASTGVARFLAFVGFMEDRPQIVGEKSAVKG